MDETKNESEVKRLPTFRIWLCGAFRVERSVNGGCEAIRTSEWGGSNYPRLLLKALLCCPGRQARREALIDMLWPDCDLEQAVQNLNTATTKLRNVLRSAKGQESLLLTENDSTVYRLEGQALLWVDVDEALALLKEAEVLGRTSPDALPLLEGAADYFSTGSLLQEEEGLWATGRRATVDQARYRCRLWLVEAYEQQNQPGQAETMLSALLEEDPFDEDVLCRLLLLLHRQGMTYQALRLYKHSCQVFAREGLELVEATKNVAAQLATSEKRIYTPEALTSFFSLTDGQNGILSHFSPMSTPAIIIELVRVRVPTSYQTPVDSAAWFGARVNDLKACGISLHEPITCQQQQTFISTEIEAWRTMTNQEHHQPNEYLISRRTALATLATVSTSLLAKMQFGPLTSIIMEEFLSQCATSLTTCWHLMQGRELGIVQQALTRYLPVLHSLAKQPSSYQKTSAYLASQGCLLMGLISLHTLPKLQNFQQRAFYCIHAVEYASLSTDPILQITALAHLANARYDMGQLDEMLQTYQRAISTLGDLSKHYQFPSLLCSKLQIELAHAYAQHGHVQQALRALEEAHVLFPGEHEEAPVFLSTDYGHHSLILFEGLTHLDLEKYAPNDHHSHQAAHALAKIEPVSISEQIPERFRVEIVNQQALAAIREGKLDEFEKYHIEGVKGAQALASEKRRLEAITNWKAAREQWPHEKRIMELADSLF